MVKVKTACIQLNSGNDMQENISRIAELLEDAVSEGVRFVSLPENAIFMGNGKKDTISNSYPQSVHPALKELGSLAAEHQIWLLIGSMAITSDEVEKVCNRSLLVDDAGKIAAEYDKIHLYDVMLPGGERYSESGTYKAGDKAIIAKTPWFNLGMTICYDLRFPHLFRNLAQSGAEVISVPAAFVNYTGQAHWHCLLRARAIENSCYIIAAAQCGEHPGKRMTYGHSVIINPWGEIIAEAGDTEGIIVAEIDIERVIEVRKSLPSLSHDRPFAKVC